MKYTETSIKGLWLIEPNVYNDSRGYFMETYKKEEFENTIGKVTFVQVNESCSIKGVLRGLHYQLEPYAQAKLVRVIKGSVLDVAVDIRKGSPTFGQYFSVELTGENKRQLFVPRGFAHGFCVLSDIAMFSYMVDNVYSPQNERGFRFDDSQVGINWKMDARYVSTSEKDRLMPLFKDAELNFIY